MIEKKNKKAEEKAKKKVREVWGTKRSKAGIEPLVSKDARFELRARRGPSRVPGSGVGFRFVFPFFFVSITLALAIGPLPRSRLAPLSFSLRGFGLPVSDRLLAHLLLSFLTSFLSYSFVRADTAAFVGPPGPWEAVVVPSREGGFKPNLTQSKHPPPRVTLNPYLRRDPPRNPTKERRCSPATGGRYVTNHVRCVDVVFKY